MRTLTLRLPHVVLVAALTALAVPRAAAAQSVIDPFDPKADDWVETVALDGNGRVLIGGVFFRIGGSGSNGTLRRGLARLHADGTLDATFDPGINGNVYAIVPQPDGRILVGGAFAWSDDGTGAMPPRGVGRLNADGTVDPSFNPWANGDVRVVAVQADGKVLVAGSFTAIGRGAATTPRRGIARLNADGAVDQTFNPGVNGNVRAMVVQPDGGILIGGDFTGVTQGGGTIPVPRNRIARLLSNGYVDLAFDPGADNVVESLELQHDGKILVGGNFLRLGNNSTGRRVRLGRLHVDGTLDEAFDPLIGGRVLDIAAQADGSIVIAGGFETVRGEWAGGVARLTPDGMRDRTLTFSIKDQQWAPTVHAVAVQNDGGLVIGGQFTTVSNRVVTEERLYVARLRSAAVAETPPSPTSVDALLTTRPDGFIYAMAWQPDGSMIVGGTVIGFDTATGYQRRRRLARLSPDGSLDAFDPQADEMVTALAVQPDGKFLAGGVFTGFGCTFGFEGYACQQPRRHLARFDADGSIDASFDPGADNTVWAFAVQPDGKILVGGDFTRIGGGGSGTGIRRGLARLNADGSLDATFDAGLDGNVQTIAIQTDGRILIGGTFPTAKNVRRRYIARLQPGGSLDTTFDPGASSNVTAIRVQPDGAILVAGWFTKLGSGFGFTPRLRIGRLTPAGAVDPSFDPGADNFVYTMALQADGGILIGGEFTQVGGGTGTTPRRRLARLNANGTVDPHFDPGPNGAVLSIAIDPDGGILASGTFTTLEGGGTIIPTGTLVRLTNPPRPVHRLTVASLGAAVTWLRAGGPEVTRVTFELSIEGGPFSLLGYGTRSGNAWRLNNPGIAPPPARGVLRVRGYFAGAGGGDATSVIETTAEVSSYQLSFTDEVLRSRATLIRAVHLTQLRGRIDGVRMAVGLTPVAWTDARLRPGMTVRAAHVNELRTALADAYRAARRVPPASLNSSLSPRGSIIRAVDIDDLRSNVRLLEFYISADTPW